MNKAELKSLQLTFEQYGKNESWFNANFEEFEKNYREKFIAVISPGRFLVKDNLDGLLKEIEKKKLLESAFITSIPPEDVASIFSILSS